MIQRKEFYISCDGIRLHCKLDRPVPEPSRASHSGKIPMVLVIPGLTGHMEEPHIAAIAEALPRNGYACLRVELYGHGKSGGDFHDHTLLHWALELMEVIDYARKLEYVSELYLCGHSQGGTAAVLGAGLKPDALDGLILLAPAMPISGNYYRVNRLLPFDDAIRLYGNRPVLVVHSKTDELVPFRYGEETAAAYQNAELTVIEEDDHCFETHIDLVTEAMIRFLDRIHG